MNDNVALITGASGGLGRAVAAHLAESGWRLALVGRTMARLEASGPAEALRIEADVSTHDGARAAVAQCTESLGLPAVLINCAGSSDEVAQTIAWLLSPTAARITGQVLPIDGGFTAIRPLVR